MRRRRILRIALSFSAATAALSATALHAQQDLPPAVRYAARAVDSILTTPGGRVSLEAFRGDTVTGVYLLGQLAERQESVGYGIDGGGGRYLWLSIERGDSLDIIAMVLDLDLDLNPDFLLLRTVDHRRRIETATEYRAPPAVDHPLDIAFQPACAPPRCDPATWSVTPRRVREVPSGWLARWRPLFGLAAMRGERWLGEPVTALHAVAPPAPPPEK